MNSSIHHRIKTLIEDTSDAFSSSGAMNADYPEFASLAVSEFRALLSQPGLTRGQLTTMLRTGLGASRAEDPDNWPHFLARHIAMAVNVNRAE